MEENFRCPIRVSHGKFFELLKQLEGAEKVQKASIDGKWEEIDPRSRNSNREEGQ
jgi:hypothetical protein